MEPLSAKLSSLPEVKDYESFKGYVENQILISIDEIKLEKFIPELYVIKDQKLYAFAVPDGQSQISEFFVGVSNAMQGAVAYLFQTESWSLTVPRDDVDNYTFNPSEIVNNPFKQERLSFIANGFSKMLSGYVILSRNDAGERLVGDTIILEPDSKFTHFMDVADLLLPMLD